MDVIELTRQLGKTIQQDARYLKLMVAQQQNDNDEALQALIGKFNLKRIDLNTEMNSPEKDQAKIAALNDEVRSLYTQVMDNESMAAYNEAKTDVDSMMEFVMQILRGTLNGDNPDTIEMQSGCSGSCDSCSGCH